MKFRAGSSFATATLGPTLGPVVEFLGFEPRTNPPDRLSVLPPAVDVDGVLANLDTIIDWAISVESPVGYFAAVYRRATLTVKAAIDAGEFGDRDRMQRLDLAFAQRYFDALNAFFNPGEYQTPTATWQWALVGNTYQEPTILQHLLTGLNAHINLDLAIAAADFEVEDISTLKDDFDKINALLASQVQGVLDAMGPLSPGIATARRLIPDEVGIISELLIQFRTAAWSFANQLFHDKPNALAAKDVHDSWASVLATCYLHPKGSMGSVAALVKQRESADVAHNIKVLNQIQPPPEPIHANFR